MREMTNLMELSKLAKKNRKEQFDMTETNKDRLVRELLKGLGYELYMSNDITYGDEEHKFEYLLNSNGKHLVAVVSTVFMIDFNKLSDMQLKKLVDISAEDVTGIEDIKAVMFTNGIDIVFIDMAANVYDAIKLDKLSYSEADRLAKYSKERLGTLEFTEDTKQLLFNRRIKQFASQSIGVSCGISYIKETLKNDTNTRKDTHKALIHIGDDTVDKTDKTEYTGSSKPVDFVTWKEARNEVAKGITKNPIKSMVILGHVYNEDDCDTYSKIFINTLLNLKSAGKLTRDNLKASKLCKRSYGFHDTTVGLKNPKYVEEVGMYFQNTMDGYKFTLMMNTLIKTYNIGERGILVKFA